MNQTTLRNPELRPAHPGELLTEAIDEMGEGKAEIARRLGVTRAALYNILDGKSAVTASMAVKLETIIGSSAEMWLGMQTAFDLWSARQAVKQPAGAH